MIYLAKIDCGKKVLQGAGLINIKELPTRASKVAGRDGKHSLIYYILHGALGGNKEL